jgi:hypothetical protein
MNNPATHYMLFGILVAIMTSMSFWLLLQVLMALLCWDIKRVLRVKKMTAYEYLQEHRFWKTKTGKYVWFLKGPGMYMLARKLLKLAKNEVKETNFKTNETLFNQCTACIFLKQCIQKYDPDCQHCFFYTKCQVFKNKKTNRICDDFKCLRWIEID